MPEHDSLYKRLFSHPEMVHALLDGFLSPRWTGQLDFSTLEKTPAAFITQDRRARYGDLVWCIRVQASGQRIYLLFEFQSRGDKRMPVRITTYLSLLYEDQMRQHTLAKMEHLPVVVPLVLYSGRAPWRAQRDIGTLIAPFPDGLQALRPRVRYLLLDQVRLVASGALPRDNLVAAFFQIQSGTEPAAVKAALQTLNAGTQAPACAALRGDFVRWLTEKPFTAAQSDMLFKPDDEQEVQMVLAKMIKEMLDRSTREGLEAGLAQGLEQGLEQGIARGAQQGRHALLEHLLTHRFGPLSMAQRERLNAANTEQLDRWAIALLDAPTLDAVFRQSLH